MNPPKAERAKPSLSSDYNLLFKNKIGESSLDIHRCVVGGANGSDSLTAMMNSWAIISGVVAGDSAVKNLKK